VALAFSKNYNDIEGVVMQSNIELESALSKLESQPPEDITMNGGAGDGSVAPKGDAKDVTMGSMSTTGSRIGTSPAAMSKSPAADTTLAATSNPLLGSLAIPTQQLNEAAVYTPTEAQSSAMEPTTPTQGANIPPQHPTPQVQPAYDAILVILARGIPQHAECHVFRILVSLRNVRLSEVGLAAILKGCSIANESEESILTVSFKRQASIMRGA
jgi:hypothetical protein